MIAGSDYLVLAQAHSRQEELFAEAAAARLAAIARCGSAYPSLLSRVPLLRLHLPTRRARVATRSNARICSA